MSRTAKNLKTEPEPMEDDVKNRLDQIAAKLKAGADPSDFEGELDQLLGTEMDDRDEVAEATWEDSYRNRGSDS